MEAVLAGVAVLAVGVLLAFGIKRFSLGDSVTFLALMLLPMLTYGVASGKVQEFTAPGGWGAKFREVADNQVDAVPITVLDGAFVAKGGSYQLIEAARSIPPGQPVAVTLQLGVDFYQEDAIRDYVQVLSAKDPEASVVIIDSAGKYIASAKGSVVLNLLGGPESTRFMEVLTRGTPQDMLTTPGFSDKSIAETANNVAALEKMEHENTSRLVAVTSDNTPKGIVVRDMIVSRLLVGLAADKR